MPLALRSKLLALWRGGIPPRYGRVGGFLAISLECRFAPSSLFPFSLLRRWKRDNSPQLPKRPPTFGGAPDRRLPGILTFRQRQAPVKPRGADFPSSPRRGLLGRGTRPRSGTQGRWLKSPCLFCLLLLCFSSIVHAQTAGLHLIPTEELADAAKRGAVGLVSPQKNGGQLIFAAIEGQDFPPGTLLTSPTTRTRGLIGAIDLTPEGLPVQAKPGTVAELLKFKWRIEATEASKDLLLGIYGALAGIGLLLGIAATYKAKLIPAAKGLLTFGAAATLCTLLLPALPIPGGMEAGAFLALSLILALLVRGLRGRQYPVRNLLRLLIIAIFVDTIGHFGLIANSALSAYYMAGIRFYGIGNEYMGLLLGSVIMCVPLGWLPYVGFATALLLGLSPLGADAGGAVVAIAALTPWPPLPLSRSIRGWERVRPLLIRFGLGIGMAILLALIERYVLPAEQRSHIGRAAGGGSALWLDIIQRKIQMNLRLSTIPLTLAALAGVGGTTVWLAKSPVGTHIKRNTELSQRVAQGLLAAFATAVFNDSGVIAALLLLAPVLFAVVESALCATSESTTEPNESASP